MHFIAALDAAHPMTTRNENDSLGAVQTPMMCLSVAAHYYQALPKDNNAPVTADQTLGLVVHFFFLLFLDSLKHDVPAVLW